MLEHEEINLRDIASGWPANKPHELRIEMEVSEMSFDGTIPPGAARITDILVDGKSIRMDLDEAERIGNAATDGPWESDASNNGSRRDPHHFVV